MLLQSASSRPKSLFQRPTSALCGSTVNSAESQFYLAVMLCQQKINCCFSDLPATGTPTFEFWLLDSVFFILFYPLSFDLSPDSSILSLTFFPNLSPFAFDPHGPFIAPLRSTLWRKKRNGIADQSYFGYINRRRAKIQTERSHRA